MKNHQFSCDKCKEKTKLIFNIEGREIHLYICKHYSKEDMRSLIMKLIEDN